MQAAMQVRGRFSCGLLINSEAAASNYQKQLSLVANSILTVGIAQAPAMLTSAELFGKLTKIGGIKQWL